MPSQICLQGGAEFRPGCESMDLAMLTGADPAVGATRRVLVAPFAGAPGRERSMAAANAVRWYRDLGATELAVAPTEDDDFGQKLSEAQLLVLPGGSPARLLAALAPHRSALRDAVRSGLAISGASAGAMVLCRFTVLPAGRLQTVPGLGIAPVDLVLPHFRGNTRWLDSARATLPDGAFVLGLPERSGVIIEAGGLRQVGVEPVTELTVPDAGPGRRHR